MQLQFLNLVQLLDAAQRAAGQLRQAQSLGHVSPLADPMAASEAAAFTLGNGAEVLNFAQLRKALDSWQLAGPEQRLQLRGGSAGGVARRHC